MNQDGELVTLVDLIDRLVEVSEPAPISMWPQTWGWWAVGGFLLASIVLTTLFFMRRYRANAYRRTALAELDAAGDDAVAVAGILRRTALSAFPRQAVCHLAGEDWLKFLESTADGVVFTTGPGSAIASAPYQPGIEISGIGPLAKQWVRRHRLQVSA